MLSTPRPQLSAVRNRYVYYPDAEPVSEWQAISIRNRSFTIGDLVDIPAPRACCSSWMRTAVAMPCT
jgi:hypothetical protein